MFPKAISFFALLFFGACSGQPADSTAQQIDPVNLIPQPQQIDFLEGYFQIDAATVILPSPTFQAEANYLQTLLATASTFKTKISAEQTTKNYIQFKEDPTLESKEAYRLKIQPTHIEISAATANGAMHAVQSLRQLFQTSFHQKEKRATWLVPCLEVSDHPRFQHRGMLLDVCRHFFDKQVIFKYIDLLAYYKMNVLHFHLTEDQGWRIEIEKYPKLNTIASWRTEADGSRYGGYYTKADLKEMVAYAQERHITIIPEIELPGHAQAALAAYPEFSCVGEKEKIEVVNDWGVFKEIYCAGNEGTFQFLEAILTEVMEIFPSEYIHIGGDEAPKFRWENCKKCQRRIKEKGLHDTHELQNYFITRIEKFLNANDRKLIGWDEILEGGLAENATVQSWRGMGGGINAANAGHQAIMSPTSHCYLDYSLDMIDLKKVYDFDPIPTDLDTAKHNFIIGGECNMWTEHVPDEATLDARINPRMQALAEVLWTYPKKRNFQDFYQRIQTHYPALKAFNVAYGLEAVPAKINSKVEDGKLMVFAESNLEDLTLSAKWVDEEKFQPIKKFPLQTSGEFQVQAKKGAEMYGEVIRQKFEAHLALAKTVEYLTDYNDWYPANGKQALVDGKVASLDFRDGNWQGFYGNDAIQIVDLGKIEKINSVAINFYQYNNAWIFLPPRLYVQVSTDGKKWEDYGIVLPNFRAQQRGKFIEQLKVERTMSDVQFIRIEVENVGKVPAWHEAAGSDAWIFMDEIIVK
ncbi:MAG: family 20 glycosylhydrolase [Saprospiraceae bacterium]